MSYLLEEDHSTTTLLQKNKDLILHNDDFNTFDFVINSLVKVCNHAPEQAEQCAYIVHYKGKCQVKIGEYDKLLPMKDALQDRGLTVTIE